MADDQIMDGLWHGHVKFRKYVSGYGFHRYQGFVSVKDATTFFDTWKGDPNTDFVEIVYMGDQILYWGS